MLTQRDKNYANVLTRVLELQPTCILSLLNTIKRLNASQQSLVFKANSTGLITAFNNSNNLIRESLKNFDEESLSLLFRTKPSSKASIDNSGENNLLMDCIFYHLFSRMALLTIVDELPMEMKIAIFTQRDHLNRNVLLLAIEMGGQFKKSIPILQKIIEIIGTLPTPVIIDIFNTRSSILNYNGLELQSHQEPKNLVALFSLEPFAKSLSVQWMIAKKVHKEAFKHNLSRALQQLDEDKVTYESEVISDLQKRLAKMVINKSGKQAKVLDEYHSLKDESDFPKNLAKALTDKASGIYHALAIDRLPFNFVGEATSVRRLQGLRLGNHLRLKSNSHSANISTLPLVFKEDIAADKPAEAFKTLLFRASSLKPEEIRRL